MDYQEDIDSINFGWYIYGWSIREPGQKRGRIRLTDVSYDTVLFMLKSLIDRINKGKEIYAKFYIGFDDDFNIKEDERVDCLIDRAMKAIKSKNTLTQDAEDMFIGFLRENAELMLKYADVKKSGLVIYASENTMDSTVKDPKWSFIGENAFFDFKHEVKDYCYESLCCTALDIHDYEY